MVRMIFRQLYLVLLIIAFCQCHGNSKSVENQGKLQSRVDTSEKVQSVRGQFKSNNQVIQLSAAMEKLLFVLNKGDIYLPENGFFLHLSQADAKRLGTAYILLIPLFPDRENLFFTYDRDFTFEIVAVPGMENCYYTKNVTFFNAHNKDKIASENDRYPVTIFNQPTLKDTIEWSIFSDYRDLRHVPQWIDHLDNNQQVMVHYVGCAETTDGGYAIHDYRPTTVADLARKRLNDVSNQMESLGVPAAEASQHEWKTWLDKVISLNPKDQFKKRGAKVWTKTFQENTNGLFALDEAKDKIIRLHPQPNYLNFKDQQLLCINPADSSIQVGKIASPQQPNAAEFVDFRVENGTLFTINKLFQWGQYSAEPSNEKTTFYKERASKKLLSLVRDMIIDHTYMTPEHSYILYHKDRTVNYEMLCINSKTGAIIAQKNVDRLLTEAHIAKGKIEYLPSAAMNTISPDFPLLFKLNEVIYHLSLNAKLEPVETVKLPPNLPWHPRYLSADKQAFYFDKADNELWFYPITQKKSIPSIKLKDHLFDRYIMLPDGDNFRFFYEYGDTFTHGIKTVLINGSTFKQEGEAELVYSYVPLETESSDNTPNNLNAFKIGSKWIVTFMLEQKLVVAEI
ncbi:hypothetical protein [Sphingobacterium sp. CZ-UAM]|uniref:hypothetical protein n=1 Tax=Sphingobacterium sp. CZ-UAM TaxID=1933868 RepID=UPI0011159674|nr:hypothetical protein [Sphingobacterium sp. CZ-UAM]